MFERAFDLSTKISLFCLYSVLAGWLFFAIDADWLSSLLILFFLSPLILVVSSVIIGPISLAVGIVTGTLAVVFAAIHRRAARP
ncbi:MAG: hypothetical protein LBE33_05750 [Zoogloeaceae bacterium]|jgi:hypothetical protein|nr:hypothetical protein [Zoogloeaceae bacterium]